MATSKATKIPPLIYGTAWKKDQTRSLVRQALLAGFRGVDTAAQPKHYQEDLVGQGIRDAINEGVVTRSDLYIQTKFTSIHGQDARKPMPYNPQQSIAEQVSSSIASSLHNLRPPSSSSSSSSPTEEEDPEPYIDCLILHSPFPTLPQTLEAWHAMEHHVPNQIRTLGISNIYQIDLLSALYESAHVKPSVVQNRFYPDTRHDTEIRKFCAQHGLVYECFWTLTANPHLLRSRPVRDLAAKCEVSAAVALYGLVLGLGATRILDGTRDGGHMREDLEGVERIRTWSRTADQDWTAIMTAFKGLIGD